MNQLVSVIVPIYNVENWITKTITSLVNQTYKNIEIILVNDESTDGTDKIINNFSRQDERIKVINKENGGLSSARNVGLEKASGDFVIFVDGDDWLEITAIEKLIEIFAQDPYDVAFFPYVRVFENCEVFTPLFDEEMFFNSKKWQEVFRQIIGPIHGEVRFVEKLDRLSTAWGKMYRREVITQPFKGYEENYPEDLFFNIQNLRCVKKAVYTESARYFYNKVNDSSVTNSDNVLYKFERSNRLMKLIRADISKEDELLALNNREYMRILSFVMNVMNAKMPMLKKYKTIRHMVDKIVGDVNVVSGKSQLKDMSIPWRTFYHAVLTNKCLLVFLLGLTVVCARKFLIKIRSWQRGSA